jgi:hypothetical protein
MSDTSISDIMLIVASLKTVVDTNIARLAALEAQMPPRRNRGRNSKKQVAERYNRTPRTIDRWRTDPESGFPPGQRGVNGRWEWTSEELAAFDASQNAKASKPV